MTELTAANVRKFFDYDPERGKLFWKVRTPEDFSQFDSLSSRRRICKIWNSNYAGKEAGKTGRVRRQVTFYNKMHKVHRVIWLWMTGEWPNIIDHINGDFTDNRWENLRNVNIIENTMNTGQRKDNTSGCKGVCWDKNRQKWLVRVSIGKTVKHVGRFDCKEEAFAAYVEAAREAGYTERHIFGDNPCQNT